MEMDDILAVAKSVGMNEKKAKIIAGEIRECVEANLMKEWTGELFY